MNCQRRRSGPSFEVDAAPTPVRDGPGRARRRPARAGGKPGTSPEPAGARTAAPSVGTPRTSASTGTPRTIRTIRSPATARRAVVIGLQPAANGRGCGLCV